MGYSIAGPVASPGLRTTTSCTGVHGRGDGLCEGQDEGRVFPLPVRIAYSNVRPSHSNGVQMMAVVATTAS
jgi:hypothetical protein